MPTYEYKITIIGSGLDGFTIIKYSRHEMENSVDYIREHLGLDCKVQEKKLV
jgi:hypothetical protein